MPRSALSRVLVVSLDGQALQMDYRTSRTLWEYQQPTDEPVSFARYSPNGHYFLLSTVNGAIKLFENERQQVVRTFRGHVNSTYCIFASVTASSRYLVSGSENGRVLIWNVKTQRVVQVTEAHDDPVGAADAHPRCDAFASASFGKDSIIKILKNEGIRSTKESSDGELFVNGIL